VTRVDSHNHAPNEFAIKWGLLLKEMHKKIADNPTVPVWQIYDKATDNVVPDFDDIAGFDNLRSRAKCFRVKFVPILPVDVDDVVIDVLM